MRIVATVLVVLLLIAAGWFVLLYAGAYNVAATQPHSGFTSWSFETLMHNSVESHAEGVGVPADLSERSRIETGFSHYSETCEICHGGPGVETTEIAMGMLPQPPKLAEEAGEWGPEELFWITKNGIKMTGMPAFGPTHADEDLWSIVAFVQALPDLSAEEYARLEETVGGHDHAGGGHGEGGEEEGEGEDGDEGHEHSPGEGHQG